MALRAIRFGESSVVFSNVNNETSGKINPDDMMPLNDIK